MELDWPATDGGIISASSGMYFTRILAQSSN
jgi:hypothetical protein